ncbi:MAG: D-alanine--D-alanine ligase [Chloroflexi bacterium]|nr:D-alanine--D-alanine ligase [Chloroflexota bacterium]
MRRLWVGVIFGGPSPEHEVSIASALSVMEAMDRERYEVVAIGITKEGYWLSPRQTAQALRQVASKGGALKWPGRDSRYPVLAGPGDNLAGVDVAFPLVHGPYGEDGTLQGLLEAVNMPYVGCGVAASVLGMDKALMKALFQHRGLPVVPYLVLGRQEWQQKRGEVIAAIEEGISFPCFVKPACLGSSVGVSKVASSSDLFRAVEMAARWDNKIIVEEAVVGREVECAILGNQEPTASVVGEVRPAREFYDYEAKYNDSGTQLIVPASLPGGVENQIRGLSVAAFQSIGGSGMARVDFFLANDGRVFINEINTIPGFTSVSMYPRLWEASGIVFSSLIHRLVTLAMERSLERVWAARRDGAPGYRSLKEA